MTAPEELSIYRNVICNLNDSAYWADLEDDGEMTFSFSTDGDEYIIFLNRFILFSSTNDTLEEGDLDLELKRFCHNTLLELRGKFIALTDHTSDWLKEK